MANPQRKKVMLKFKTGKNHLNIALENALVGFDFKCYSRKLDDWVIYEKYLDPASKRPPSGLSDQKIKHLESRLKRIVDSYLDPYSHTAAIRAQCMMVADSLSGLEREWVMDWVANTIDNEYYGEAPWENWTHQGSC